MKCPFCNQDLGIQIATNLRTKNCKIQKEIISLVTVQCEKCGKIFKVPIKSRSFMSLKEDK